MNIDVNVLIRTLPINLYGMAGIFVVMGFVYACIKLMNRLFTKK